MELRVLSGAARSSSEPHFVAAGCSDPHPEYQVLAPRSAQHLALAWLLELNRLAASQRGALEWHTQMIWPGSLPFMTGGGVE
eukprot:6013837-Lingulodinium_polyedra.AAC.1